MRINAISSIPSFFNPDGFDDNSREASDNILSISSVVTTPCFATLWISLDKTDLIIVFANRFV